MAMGILVVPTVKLVYELGGPRDEVAQEHPQDHGQDDPEGEKALHETQTFGNRAGHIAPLI